MFQDPILLVTPQFSTSYVGAHEKATRNKHLQGTTMICKDLGHSIGGVNSHPGCHTRQSPEVTVPLLVAGFCSLIPSPSTRQLQWVRCPWERDMLWPEFSCFPRCTWPYSTSLCWLTQIDWKYLRIWSTKGLSTVHVTFAAWKNLFGGQRTSGLASFTKRLTE